MFQHNTVCTVMYTAIRKENFPVKMKTRPYITLLLKYVIWYGVTTCHMTFYCFTQIGSHFRAKNRNSVCLSPIRLCTATLTVIFPNEMKMFSLMTLLLHSVIWDLVATFHVTFHWFIWIGSHFRAKNRNSLCFSTICLCTATPTEWFFLRKCKCFL